MPRLQLLHQGQKSPLYRVLVIYVLIDGRQKGTESKARLPDNVTLGKDLQLSMLPPPHLEDEDNNICLRNIVISVTENTMQTGPGTQQMRGHAQGTPTCLAPVTKTLCMKYTRIPPPSRYTRSQGIPS